MPSRRNLETVERIYELASRRPSTETDPDANPIVALFDPDVVIEENAAFPDSDAYHGYKGLARWWGGLLEVFDEMELRPIELVEAGDRVAATVRHRLRSRAGVEVEREITHVWTLRDGRVVHATGFNERDAALAALREP